MVRSPPTAEGQPFPTRKRVCDDLARMQALGANSIRVYHVPPEWLLDLVDERGMTIFMDIPWPTHVCFLQSRRAQADARRSVRQAAEAGRDHPSILAYNIGNEIPTDIIRWHGTRRVERFLAELRDVVKQADPDGLVTYASYPPTEYLDLSFLDFVTFNVYLHDRAAFRDYVFRLQNLVGDRPLVLGELGLDTLRHGEAEQARLLAGHLRETELMGLAGAYVFSWTDDWHTGGYPVEDWAFGITDADRIPKVSYHAVQQVFTAPLPAPAGGDAAGVGGRLLAQRRGDPRRVPAIAGRPRLSGLRGHRRRRWLDRRYPRDPRAVPRGPGHPPGSSAA